MWENEWSKPEIGKKWIWSMFAVRASIRDWLSKVWNKTRKCGDTGRVGIGKMVFFLKAKSKISGETAIERRKRRGWEEEEKDEEEAGRQGAETKMAKECGRMELRQGDRGGDQAKTWSDTRADDHDDDDKADEAEEKRHKTRWEMGKKRKADERRK